MRSMRNQELNGWLGQWVGGVFGMVSDLDGSFIVCVCIRHLEISSSHLTVFVFHLASWVGRSEPARPSPSVPSSGSVMTRNTDRYAWKKLSLRSTPRTSASASASRVYAGATTPLTCHAACPGSVLLCHGALCHDWRLLHVGMTR